MVSTQEFAARPIQYVLIRINTLRMAVIIGATIFSSATVAFLTPSPAIAKPEFAARTGPPCAQWLQVKEVGLPAHSAAPLDWSRGGAIAWLRLPAKAA
jgi:hypothetical protein